MKILFIGNSITLHPPKEDIGWLGNYGMAASCEENDYVHVLCSMLEADCVTVQKLVTNASVLEMKPYAFDINSLSEQRDFDADIIIIRLAENTNVNTLAAFGEKFSKMIEYLTQGRSAKVFCIGSFWNNDEADKIIEDAAGKKNAEYISLESLHDEKYRAIGLFKHDGVASHPSDIGMKAIAEIIYSRMKQSGLQI